MKAYYENYETKEINIMETESQVENNIYEINNPQKLFNPVSMVWQKMQCRRLNLNIECLTKNSLGSIKLLKPPSKMESILGDGNCFYLAISWWITGSEINHFEIRLHLAEV